MSTGLDAGRPAAAHSPNGKVGVVVLNFNSFEDTRRCLTSLGKLLHNATEIICVDNGSSDDSFPKLSAEFPSARFLRNERNLGFGGGVNTGFKEALRTGCDFVFCLNNDAFVDDPDAVAKLLRPFETDPKIGLTGPAEYDSSGANPKFSGPTGRSRFEMKVSGAAFMVSRKVLETVGMLDEGFFLLYEDQDLFVRIEKAGFRVQLVKDARFMHAGSSSTSKHSALMEYLEARNRIIYFARHWGISGFMQGVIMLYAKRLPRLVLTYSEQGRPELLMAYLKGILDGFVALPNARYVGKVPPIRFKGWAGRASRTSR